MPLGIPGSQDVRDQMPGQGPRKSGAILDCVLHAPIVLHVFRAVVKQVILTLFAYVKTTIVMCVEALGVLTCHVDPLKECALVSTSMGTN